MTINIQKCANVTVSGHHNHKNCKAVYCITTGEMYPSILDAASANEMSYGAMCQAIAKGSKCRNGKKFCLIVDVVEHLEEISDANKLRSAKVAAYDADMKRRLLISNAEKDVQKHEAKVAELRRKLEEAETELKFAKYDLDELKGNN